MDLILLVSLGVALLDLLRRLLDRPCKVSHVIPQLVPYGCPEGGGERSKDIGEDGGWLVWHGRSAVGEVREGCAEGVGKAKWGLTVVYSRWVGVRRFWYLRGLG